MRKTTLFSAALTIILALFCLDSTAQSNKYFGVRAQVGGVLSETSAAISTKGGFSGGIGFCYMYLLTNQLDITIDGVFSVSSLQSNERDFDAATQTWTVLGKRTINFMTPEITFLMNKSFSDNRRFKSGLGVFCSKNIQKTRIDEQPNYWGNAPLIEENYALNNRFLTGLNYGVCAESSVNLGIFQVSARYKHGFANINTEGSTWRQHYLQLGVTYFFGTQKREELKQLYDDKQRYNF